ncbi:MAG: tetratricopeptide repeat protein, partial [Candidatus Omnitrophica bacterium COP1]|nr:tetratricopeptide repeat protein [Candidatus Omnitrophica bacterium COP1]
AHFQAAIQLEPQAAQAYYNLGVALTQAGKAAEAEEAYRYCLGIVPGYAEAWNNLGILYANLGRIEQAKEAFLRAIEQKPGNQEFQGNLREAERLLRER